MQQAIDGQRPASDDDVCVRVECVAGSKVTLDRGEIGHYSPLTEAQRVDASLSWTVSTCASRTAGAGTASHAAMTRIPG